MECERTDVIVIFFNNLAVHIYWNNTLIHKTKNLFRGALRSYLRCGCKWSHIDEHTSRLHFVNNKLQLVSIDLNELLRKRKEQDKIFLAAASKKNNSSSPSSSLQHEYEALEPLQQEEHILTSNTSDYTFLHDAHRTLACLSESGIVRLLQAKPKQAGDVKDVMNDDDDVQYHIVHETSLKALRSVGAFVAVAASVNMRHLLVSGIAPAKASFLFLLQTKGLQVLHVLELPSKVSAFTDISQIVPLKVMRCSLFFCLQSYYFALLIGIHPKGELVKLSLKNTIGNSGGSLLFSPPSAVQLLRSPDQLQSGVSYRRIQKLESAEG